MPYKEKSISGLKQYWSVGEVAKELELLPSTIRYWVNYFNIRISRKETGRGGHDELRFNEKEKQLISRIKTLKQSGEYTSKGIKNRL